MVVGSHISFSENVSYTKYITTMAHVKGMTVEVELGWLSGTEDNITVEEYEAKLTYLAKVGYFIHSQLYHRKIS